MSEVNLQFTVNNFSSTITLAATELAINPQATELTVFGGFAAYPPAGGAGDTQVTFNDAGLFAGSTNFTYNKNSNTLSVDNLNTTSIISSGPLNTGTIYVTGEVFVSGTVGANNLSVTGLNDMGAVGNLRLTNTTAGQYIKTLGSNFLEIGNLAAAGQPQQLQFNNATEFGGIPTVTWDGTDLVVGDADNVKMYGGINGYVLQTDGSGNLTWLPQAGAISPSTGAPGGANSQVQYNRAGVFSGDPSFKFNNITQTLTVANLVITGSTSGLVAITVSASSQPNITSTGTLTGLNVAGTTRIQQGIEKVSVNTGNLSGTITWDILISGSIQYYTANSTGNSTVNFRGNSTTTLDNMMVNGESLTVALLTTIGTTAYWPTSIKIDGANTTVKYIDGVGPSITTITPSSVTCINYTFIKTSANTFTTIGTFNSFK